LVRSLHALSQQPPDVFEETGRSGKVDDVQSVGHPQSGRL